VVRSCNELPPGGEAAGEGVAHGDKNGDKDRDRDADRDTDGGVGVFMDRGLEAKSVYQVMFILFPKGGVEGEMPFHLGRLEIDWVGSMGEKGSFDHWDDETEAALKGTALEGLPWNVRAMEM